MRYRTYAFLIGLLVLPVVLFAQQGVDREELERQITRTVVFQNYQGPYERIDTIDAIRGIGVSLAAGLRPGSDFILANRYRIINAVDPDVLVGLDADIMVILPEARVDHINNVRRILAAYLEQAYGYRSSQAAVLAEFVTIYNAIYRGDMAFFSGRYKRVVMQHLSAENAGISTLYRDWPGRTRMVVPLRGAGLVDPLALTDDRVIEELRERDDMGLEPRREIIDLAEESVQRDEERVAEREREVEEARREIAEERRAIEEERREAERREDPPEEAARREAERVEREARVAEREREVEEAEQQVEREQEEIAERTERIRELRDEVAEDTRTVMERAPVAAVTQEVLFVQTSLRDGRPVGRLVVIDSASAVVLRQSSLERVTSRMIHRWGTEHLLIAEQNGVARLIRVDSTSLEPVVVSPAELFAESIVVPRPDRGEVFAVVRDGGVWYLGKFSGNLELIERSSISVDPYTQMTIAGEFIFVQRPDGSISALSLDDVSRR